MPEQLQFDLAHGRQRPFVSARLDELIAILEESRRWMKRSELQGLGFSERELRELAEIDVTGEIFSYPGSPGYKAYIYVTEKEFTPCRALHSQGKKMVHRFIRYWRRRHQGKPLPK
jgi:hypothetical protein